MIQSEWPPPPTPRKESNLDTGGPLLLAFVVAQLTDDVALLFK